MSDLREKAIKAFCFADERSRYEAIDAAIAVCMEEAAPLIEAAFKEGLLRADGLTNSDLAWKNSEAAAALRVLRGEGGVDG